MDMLTKQRLERRAAMLATAREMIAEVGYEAVKVRDLAERCRVSVPTLYNQFGGKDGLLGAAIEDHFVGVMNGGALSRADSGFKRLLVIVDQCAQPLISLIHLAHGLETGDWTAAVGYHDRLALLNLADNG